MEPPTELRAAILRTWFARDNQRTISEWDWARRPVLRLPRLYRLSDRGPWGPDPTTMPTTHQIFDFVMKRGYFRYPAGQTSVRTTIECEGVRVVDCEEFSSGPPADHREPDVVEASRS